VIFRGVPFGGKDAEGLNDQVRKVVSDTLEEAAEDQVSEIDLIQEDLHDDVAEFIWKKLKRRPLVLPVVVEV
jgi:ribonuclease J